MDTFSSPASQQGAAWFEPPIDASTVATQRGAQAFERLLRLAETRDSGQVRRIAKFVAAAYNGEAFPFDLFDLRTLDIEISNDMLLCIDGLRWGRADLHTLVANGDCRVQRVIRLWGLAGPAAS